MRPWTLLAVGALLNPYGMPGPALVAPPPNGKAPRTDVVLAHPSPFHRRVEPSGREPYDTYQAEAHFAVAESGAAVVLSEHDHTAVVTRLVDGDCKAHGLARLPDHGGWAVLHLDGDRPSVTRPPR